MEKGEFHGNRELFLDTTYVLPFFQVPISVEGFELSDFKALISDLSRVHLSELSVYEAKAKLLSLSRRHRGYDGAIRSFGENLEVLRLDERFVFHNYSGEADSWLNQILPAAKRLDAFDMLILAEAFAVGELLTEDRDILTFRDSDQFARSQLSKSFKIRCWKEVRRKA